MRIVFKLLSSVIDATFYYSDVARYEAKYEIQEYVRSIEKFTHNLSLLGLYILFSCVHARTPTYTHIHAHVNV